MKTTIREVIESIIVEHAGVNSEDAQKTALHIIKYMDELFDINGNGWFEEDQVVKQFFKD